MEIALKKYKICITLTYNRWTNIKNKHLLGTVLLLFKGKPYIWKAIDISSECENYQEVINKTESMLSELELIDIKSGQEPKCILHKFNNFHLKYSHFDNETYQHFENKNILSYWYYVKDLTKELELVTQKVLNMSKLHANITYQYHHKPDDLFSTFLNSISKYDNTTTQMMHDNTTTQMMHNNTTTQIIYNNTLLIQITYDNTDSLNAEISDINIANSNNDIGLSQNKYLDKENKEIEDNKECNLSYISKTNFDIKRKQVNHNAPANVDKSNLNNNSNGTKKEKQVDHNTPIDVNESDSNNAKKENNLITMHLSIKHINYNASIDVNESNSNNNSKRATKETHANYNSSINFNEYDTNLLENNIELAFNLNEITNNRVKDCKPKKERNLKSSNKLDKDLQN
ncbi:9708_t:CDS:2, partial [Cetraspora pellucida]